MRISDWSSDLCSSDLTQCCGWIGKTDFLRFAKLHQLEVDALLDIHVKRIVGIQDVIHDLEIQTVIAELGKMGAIQASIRNIADNEIGRAVCGERVCNYV